MYCITYSQCRKRSKSYRDHFCDSRKAQNSTTEITRSISHLQWIKPPFSLNNRVISSSRIIRHHTHSRAEIHPQEKRPHTNQKLRTWYELRMLGTSAQLKSLRTAPAGQAYMTPTPPPTKGKGPGNDVEGRGELTMIDGLICHSLFCAFSTIVAVEWKNGGSLGQVA